MSLLFTNMYNAEKEIENKRLNYVVNYLEPLISPFRVNGIYLGYYDGKWSNLIAMIYQQQIYSTDHLVEIVPNEYLLLLEYWHLYP